MIISDINVLKVFVIKKFSVSTFDELKAMYLARCS